MKRMESRSAIEPPTIKLQLAAIVIAAITGIATSSAHAQRLVILNGRFLTDAEIQLLERQGRVSIPNGSYGLRDSGSRGYTGDPRPPGRLGENCDRPRPSLSESGLLYYSGELLR